MPLLLLSMLAIATGIALLSTVAEAIADRDA